MTLDTHHGQRKRPWEGASAKERKQKKPTIPLDEHEIYGITKFNCLEASERTRPQGQKKKKVKREGRDKKFPTARKLSRVSQEVELNKKILLLIFQPDNWMRLRGDLTSYLQELRLSGTKRFARKHSEQKKSGNLFVPQLYFKSGRFNSELVRLVLAHAWQQQQQQQQQQQDGVRAATAGGGTKVDLYRQFVARERDAARTKRRYSQLVATHQQLRRDYQKLVRRTKICTYDFFLSLMKNQVKLTFYMEHQLL